MVIKHQDWNRKKEVLGQKDRKKKVNINNREIIERGRMQRERDRDRIGR